MKRIRRIPLKERWTVALDDGYVCYADSIKISNNCSIDQAFKLIKFYFKIVNPLIEIYWKIERKIMVYLFLRRLRRE